MKMAQSKHILKPSDEKKVHVFERSMIKNTKSDCVEFFTHIAETANDY